MSGITGLLDTAKSSLDAQSQSLRTLGNNIANVNTEGYTRRRVNLETRVSGDANAQVFGAGVDIQGATRIADQFLNQNVLSSIQQRSKASVRDEFLERAETPFSLDDTIDTIGTGIAEFFSAIEDLKVDPADIGLRQEVINKGQELTSIINNTYSIISGLQREADDRLRFGVGQVNIITESIADLNVQIKQSEINGQESLGLRDQRDQKLRELSEFLSFTSVEANDGQITVSLPNGFSLVSGGIQRALEFLQVPSFGGFPRGLDGSLLGTIVYDYDETAGGTAHINLNDLIASGDGELAGLLTLRGVQSAADTDIFDAQGDLVEIAKRVEAISLELLTSFNAAFRGDDLNTPGFEGDDPLTVGTIEGEAVRRDVNGNPEKIADAYAAFGLRGYTSADLDSGNGTIGAPDSAPNFTDLQAFFASTGIQSLSGNLEFKITQPYQIATALDADGATPATAEIADGDARNLDRMLAVRDNTSILPPGALGGYTPGGTMPEIYSELVTLVGGLRENSREDLKFREEKEVQAQELREATSGVNVDEEFANLIDYQKIFEASARLVRIGDELLDELLRLL